MIHKETTLRKFIKKIGLDPEKINSLELLDQALIHKSYSADYKNTKPHNERLEFVGDAILGAIIAQLLRKTFPTMTEANMTLYKITLVKEQTLAKIAEDLEIHTILLVSKGEEKSGGKLKPSILAGALEAIIGYISLDMGYSYAYTFVNNHIFSRISSLSVKKSNKTVLQELIQKTHKTIPHYVETIVQNDTKNNIILYRSDVFVNNTLLGYGIGKNKRIAQENAAGMALSHISGKKTDNN